MGHSSIDTTEKFYSTVQASHIEKAKKTMNNLLEKPVEEKNYLFLTISGNSDENSEIEEKNNCAKSLNDIELTD